MSILVRCSFAAFGGSCAPDTTSIVIDNTRMLPVWVIDTRIIQGTGMNACLL